MSYYSITYQIKESDKQKSFIVSVRDEVLSIVKQLQRGVVSIGGELIHATIDDLEHFSIIEQNYDQVDKDGDCFSVEPDGNGDINIIYKEPIRKDITNEILNQRVVSSSKQGNIYLHQHTISVQGEYFPLHNGTKGRQVIEILLIAKYRFKRNEFTHEELLNIYQEGKYDKLIQKDFCYDGMRSALKSKVKEIKNELSIEVFKFSTIGAIISI